jgi:AraC family transcriptional regulator
MLAGISNFSLYHFHRIMRAVLGEPIGAFITRMRVETAARLLRYSDMPIQDIAYRVGYDVPSSLSKAFKLFYGITPNDYRNNKTYSIMKPITINPDLKLEQREVDLKPMQVIYILLQGEYSGNDYCGAWAKLWNYVRELGLFTEQMTRLCSDTPKSQILRKMCDETGINHICIYHDDPKVTEGAKQRADVCLSINAKVEPKGDIGVKMVEGGKYVAFLYKGPYDNLGSVYDTIYGKLIFEMDHQLASRPGFEIYLNDPESTKPEDLMTEIYIPVA